MPGVVTYIFALDWHIGPGLQHLSVLVAIDAGGLAEVPSSGHLSPILDELVEERGAGS